MGIVYSLQSKVFRFIGDIKWSGITRPFWFTFNATGYQLKGEHYRKIIDLIQPGDIVIRRFEGYIDKWFIPGFWNHCGLYVGEIDGTPEQVIHAVSEGVIQEDILNFMRTDHMIILRAPAGKKGRVHRAAIASAKKVVGAPYDFGFDFKDCDRFSCTELISHVYPGLTEGKKRFGKLTFIADDFVNSLNFKKVWNSREDKTVHSMGVVKAFLNRK